MYFSIKAILTLSMKALLVFLTVNVHLLHEDFIPGNQATFEETQTETSQHVPYSVFVQSAVIQIDATETRISFVERSESGKEEEVSFIDADTFPKFERRLDALAALMEKGGRIYELEQKLKKLMQTQAPTRTPTGTPTGDTTTPSKSPTITPTSSPTNTTEVLSYYYSEGATIPSDCGEKVGRHVTFCWDNCENKPNKDYTLGDNTGVAFGPYKKDLSAGKYRLKMEGISSNYTYTTTFDGLAFSSHVFTYTCKHYGVKSWTYADLRSTKVFFHDFEHDGVKCVDGSNKVHGIQFAIGIHKPGCVQLGKVTLYRMST